MAPIIKVLIGAFVPFFGTVLGAGMVFFLKGSMKPRLQKALLGFAAGFVLATGAIALREILDTVIRAEEDVERVCVYPILASVPDMTLPGKGSKYYGYGKVFAENKRESVIMGKGIGFAAGEAYKLLRTKLQFSFVGEADCRVIGLSGALGGEGKSLTAVNLACALSELGKRVVLMDCDMRCPSLAEKLNLEEASGLSSYLTGQSALEALIRRCDIGENEFSVIPAGQVPPNPVELLSSAQMKRALDELRRANDYVILDLPPVGEVADAMAVARETDGMLLVVRQNDCDRTALENAVRQFEFVEAKILGVVFNCVKENNGGHYNRIYRVKNRKRGYGEYGRNDRSEQSKETGK